MILDYHFTRRAVRDIASARAWYEGHSIDLGNRFVDSLLVAIRKAREHPARFTEVASGIRAIGCIGFPYRVYYEVRPDRIVIRAVYHTARDPDRWDDEDRE
jgi:plasmid stabilization system protein ParE